MFSCQSKTQSKTSVIFDCYQLLYKCTTTFFFTGSIRNVVISVPLRPEAFHQLSYFPAPKMLTSYLMNLPTCLTALRFNILESSKYSTLMTASYVRPFAERVPCSTGCFCPPSAFAEPRAAMLASNRSRFFSMRACSIVA
jgi:hypothetical protein